MKQEEKQLLLQDLCARLPYNVKLMCKWKKPAPNGTTGMLTTMDSFTLDQIYNMDCEDIPFDEVKPYLFPLSSMTEEQTLSISDYFHSIEGRLLGFRGRTIYLLDSLNKLHFDYRGLIEKGLAIDATGLNIYKEETK